MERFEEADKLSFDGKNDECLAAVKKLEAEGPVDAELLWRIARAHYLVSENTSDKEKASALATTANEYSEKAEKSEGGDKIANVQKWRALTISRLGDFSDT